MHTGCHLGSRRGPVKPPEMCLRPGQPLTCWGWQPAWGLETWPTKLALSCLAEAWLGQGAQRLEVEGIQSSSTDAGWVEVMAPRSIEGPGKSGPTATEMLEGIVTQLQQEEG